MSYCDQYPEPADMPCSYRATFVGILHCCIHRSQQTCCASCRSHRHELYETLLLEAQLVPLVPCLFRGSRLESRGLKRISFFAGDVLGNLE